MSSFQKAYGFKTSIRLFIFRSSNCLKVDLAQFFAEGEEAQLTEDQQILFSKWSTLTDRQKQILLELMDAFEAHQSHYRERCAFLFPLLIKLSTQHIIYPTCQLNTPNIKINHSTLHHFSQ